MKRLSLCACVVALSPVSSLQGQIDSTLIAAVQLSTEGRGDSAVAVVQRVLAATPVTDSLYPEALYALGVVSEDPAESLVAFRRVVIEFGLSDWADDALLRLVQLTHAAGEASATITWFERLRRDYPFSPLLPAAIYWGARAYFDYGDEVKGCRLLNEGLAAVREDIELRQQLSFYAQRCDGMGPADTTTTQTRSYFTVQVLAVRNVSAADEMLTRLSEANFDATVLRDTDGLLKVRVGRFRTRSEAMQIATNIKRRGITDQPFVVEIDP